MKQKVYFSPNFITAQNFSLRHNFVDAFFLKKASRSQAAKRPHFPRFIAPKEKSSVSGEKNWGNLGLIGR